VSTEVFDQLKALGCVIEPCGSRVTCNPPPRDTDEDWLVAMPDKRDAVSKVVNLLGGAGFRWEGNGEHYQDVAASTFMSWRNGSVNLIVSSSADFIRRHHAATSLCKRLNLLSKPDRIALFQAVLYGNEWSAA
jgi:hypothetical protein